MDLLGGYGSESDSSSSSPTPSLPAAPSAIPSGGGHGRRLLQLSSILPPSVLEMLERGGRADDADDEESDGEEATRYSPAISAATNRGGGSRNGGFLDSLPPPSSDDAGKALPTITIATEVPARPAPADSIAQQRSKMALQFASSTVEVVRTGRRAGVVHGLRGRAAVDEEEEEEDDDDGDVDVGGVSSALSSLRAAPEKIPTATAPRPASVGAAPFIPAAAQPYPAAPEELAYPAVAPDPTAVVSAPVADDGGASSSKRLARMLRGGGAPDSLGIGGPEIVSVSGKVGPYVPAAKSAGPSAGPKIRGVAVPMYDPGAGKDVISEISGKARSRHQLVSQARSAAAHQARLAEMGGGTASRGRADAKRKYGW